MLFVVILISLVVVATPKAVEIHKRSSICYHDLGCFTTGVPFFSIRRPLNFLPQSPTHLKVKFMLFTRENRFSANLLSASSIPSLTASFFQASRETKIIVHGFIDNGKVSWMHHMKDEFLKSADYNVIIVDWGHGSLPPYTQATANTRIVGALIAQLITYLKDNADARPENIHILGHSLGAHVAGYAGERIQYVGRITGMDPAEPYFQGTDIKVRLDPSDALFVDVVHTDGQSILKLGYGMKDPCGHVDYFPNGGMKQPGCDQGPLSQIALGGLTEGVKQFVACNHLRSYALVTESINSVCPFEAYKCNSYEDFNAGKCMLCSGTECGYMGFHADRSKPKSLQTHVKYFLKTGASGPFCRYHYSVRLSFGGTRSERGDLYLALSGRSGHSSEIQLTSDAIYIQPGKSYSFVMTSPHELGTLNKIQFRWVHDSTLFNPLDWNILGLRHPKLVLQKADIVNGESAQTFHFCSNNLAMETSSRIVMSHTC